MSQQGAALQNYNNELVKSMLTTFTNPHSLTSMVKQRRQPALCVEALIQQLFDRRQGELSLRSIRPNVGGLEELCARRDVAAREVAEAEREKTELERELRSISERLARTNETLAARTHTRNQYERTIAQTQAAYTKILESSQTLLTVLKQETGGLGRLTEHTGSPRTDC